MQGVDRGVSREEHEEPAEPHKLTLVSLHGSDVRGNAVVIHKERVFGEQRSEYI